MANDDQFINLIIDLSYKSLKKGNFPVGAIISNNNKIISTGVNLVNNKKDPTMHAEIVAIRKACKILNINTLNGMVLYSSIEPCIMCFSAACWAGISRIVYYCRKDKIENRYFIYNNDIQYMRKLINYDIDIIFEDRFESKIIGILNEWIKIL